MKHKHLKCHQYLRQEKGLLCKKCGYEVHQNGIQFLSFWNIFVAGKSYSGLLANAFQEIQRNLLIQ